MKYSLLSFLLMEDYGKTFGQVINKDKSQFYHGGVPIRRVDQIANLLGFKASVTPFDYLAVPIFKGKPTKSLLKPIADRIKLKLSSWKRKLLYLMDHIQLEVEKHIRNFIWSWDLEHKKLVTVSWKNICQPFQEGGLGLRFFSSLNKATILALTKKLLSSNDRWANLIRARAITTNLQRMKYWPLLAGRGSIHWVNSSTIEFLQFLPYSSGLCSLVEVVLIGQILEQLNI
ncbi:putative ribonuclease H protein [Glycine max]|nr:putative ribonuclease H protein [Glycine max]